MVIQRKTGEKIFDAANYTFLFLFVLATLYPFIHVFMTSISNAEALSGYFGFMFFPRGFSMTAYQRVFGNTDIVRSFANSIIYVLAGTTLCIVLTSMGGYVLSRKNLYWKNVITVLIVIPMYFSGGLIPFYLMIQKLHMVNTIWAIILPGVIGTYNMILVRINIQQVPVDIEDSAKIDGANHLTTLFIILIPLILPIIAVITLFQSVGLWNEWFGPSLYITKRELFPIQLILREILINDQSNSMLIGANGRDRQLIAETVKNAVTIVSIVPAICVYPFLQKYFIKGIMVGAIKG